MFRILVVALIIIFLLSYISLESTYGNNTKEKGKVEIIDSEERITIKHIETNSDYDKKYIITDSKTGCEYLAHSNSKLLSGISPLLDSFGEPSGCHDANDKWIMYYVRRWIELIKTYELREIIEGDLIDFEPSEKWEEYLLVETETEKDNIIHVNFVEFDEGVLVNNKYRITIEPVY